MSPEKLFGEFLGLGLSWRVTECVFSRPEGRVEVRIENTQEVWNSERCPKCGGVTKGYDHVEELRWDHLHVMQYRCQIICRLPRGRCDRCNHTWRVRPPWEGKTGGFTKEFEAFALMLMREMPVKKVAEILGVTDTRLWRLLQCHIAAARKEADFSNVTCVGVDEMSIRKGHRYISVFADLVQRRVLFAAAGKDAGVWPEFLEDLEAHNGHRHSLQQVSQDMSPAYLKGVQENCRNAEVIHDKYHVIANLITATERVRRREQKLRPELKESRWTFRKNPENLNEDQKTELATVKAYQMRLAFQDAYQLQTLQQARRRLQAWCRWVRMGSKRFGALFTEMEKFAGSVEKHMTGILAHWKHRITNAFMEGLNSVFSAVKRRSRGFRSMEYLTTMLYFVAGKLRLPAL
jgi:transposase